MDQDSYQFLERLLRTSTPSGFESEGQAIWKERLNGVADELRVDVHGNVIASLNAEAPVRVMLAGHCDEIGLMVTHINENGFLHFASIGGVDPNVLIGSQVKFLNSAGVVGVIGKKPVHFLSGEERKKGAEIKELWIDIGAKDRKEAAKHVAVGDPACIAANFMPLLNNRIVSKAWDNKVGVFVVAEVMRELAHRRNDLNVAVFGVSTVQEELGSRGAITAGFGIEPHAGIAIDVSFATDTPGDDKRIAGDVRLGRGPILHRGASMNAILNAMLEETAREKKIPVQWSAEPGISPTDADTMQISRRGVATSVVSAPTRYIHTPVEICSLKDVQNIVLLVTAAVLGMPRDVSFIPF